MGITTRRLAPALILGALSSVAFIAPASASAEVNHHCVEGANIHGEGSSLQAEADEKFWDSEKATDGFNQSKAPTACNGEQFKNGEEPGGKPKVTYTKEASSVGMQKWGFGGHERSDSTTQFVGTDEPPTAAQIAEMEAGKPESKLLTIPVLDEAVSVIVHLPKECTVTSDAKGNAGRFVLTQKQLEEVFAGEITKWTQITGVPGSKSAANTWTGATCENTIKRTVRGDGSGTTSIFKKYLNLVKEFPEGFGGKSWRKSGEEIENTEWPNEGSDPVERGKCGEKEACTSSGGKLAEWVQKHEGLIGYAGIADARSKHDAGTESERSANSQEGKQIFWVEVQNSGSEEKPKFQEPALVKGEEGAWDNGTKTVANCASTEFTNGASSAKFPPASTELPWNEATTKTSEKTYGICGLSYDLAYEQYDLFEGFTESQTDTVANYIKFVLGTGAEEGQALINVHSDYLPLPTNKSAKKSVLAIAQAGAEKIGWKPGE
ncbi:MAG TPA: substrate-binding domain-containing protein [Solirubrobacteraceae bacterium]|nr:substrate-binding domain-containing protein [Solirubrobacteraceae bacterium]